MQHLQNILALSIYLLWYLPHMCLLDSGQWSSLSLQQIVQGNLLVMMSWLLKTFSISRMETTISSWETETHSITWGYFEDMGIVGAYFHIVVKLIWTWYSFFHFLVIHLVKKKISQILSLDNLHGFLLPIQSSAGNVRTQNCKAISDNGLHLPHPSPVHLCGRNMIWPWSAHIALITSVQW